MSDKERKVLGKGLSALISSNKVEGTAVSIQEIMAIDIDKIFPNPSQPRKSFNTGDLKSLAQSIQAYGILQPITVRKMQGYYEIIAGERRYRAAKIAGLKKVPSILNNQDNMRALELALLENIQRENLNPIEEAEAYNALMQEFSYTQENLARKFGNSRSKIANSLRLLNLPQEVRAMIIAGKLSAGHARCLINSENPIKLAHEVINQGLSVREIEKRIQKQQERKDSVAPHAKHKDNDLCQLQEHLSNTFNTKVNISSKRDGAGKITIEYKDMVQLDYILQLIGGDII